MPSILICVPPFSDTGEVILKLLPDFGPVVLVLAGLVRGNLLYQIVYLR
jgi:hypothetical protein